MLCVVCCTCCVARVELCVVCCSCCVDCVARVVQSVVCNVLLLCVMCKMSVKFECLVRTSIQPFFSCCTCLTFFLNWLIIIYNCYLRVDKGRRWTEVNATSFIVCNKVWRKVWKTSSHTLLYAMVWTPKGWWKTFFGGGTCSFEGKCAFDSSRISLA